MAILFGYDASGNGNNWTVNNLSNTAGVGNDSLTDTPTSYGTDTGAGGEVRGNYATLNAVAKGSTAVLSNGNLQTTSSGRTSGSSIATIAMPNNSGKYYWEVSPSINVTNSDPLMAGAIPVDGSLSVDSRSIGFMAYCSTSVIAVQYQNASVALFTISYTLQTTDTLRFAYDSATNKIWIGLNGNWYNSTGGTTADPATGTNATQTVDSTKTWVANGCVDGPSSLTAIFNFGQRAFAYTAPSGFKALCTQNLPTPTIGATSTTQADNYFNALTYTGTGSTQSITSLDFQPDFLWFKSRASAFGHALFDAVRGRALGLRTDTTGAEETSSAGNDLASFNSNGFTVGAPQNWNSPNNSSSSPVVWAWRANGAGGSNTAGTITSTVSANTTSGFSIVTYTGNGVDGATVGHGLGVTPAMVIQKRRAGSIANWRVWHTAIYGTSGVTSTLYLNSTDASTSDGDNISGVSSTTFTTRGTGATNPSGNSCVAYVFAAVAGYSAFGSYTGNGSTDGPFVYLGFRPEFVMWKRSDSTGSWYIQDMARNPYNQATNSLYPNLADAETSGDDMDYLSNGFKVRDTFSYINASGGTYIYAAFAENPFKYSLAR